MRYLPRTAEALVRTYLKDFPVVGITGPRQSGKSTMLAHLLQRGYRYVTFDDFTHTERFHTDPVGFMREFDDRVVFDEVQIVPEIFRHLKTAVDADRDRRGKFVLTGSSQFAFLKGVSESLAGRIGLFSLLPLELSEMPAASRAKASVLGSYPEIVLRKFLRRDDWYASYLDTYLTRDIRTLREIGDMRDFRRCIHLLAARAGQLLNMSDLSRDIGVTVATIKKWISVLEASYIIFLLPPYYKNFGKRIVKSPKVFFYDTGLITHVMGISSVEAMERHPLTGHLFENIVISEIMKREVHRNTRAELSFVRTNHGVEVDLVIDRRSSVEYVEVKSAASFSAEMLRGLDVLAPATAKRTLLYRGKSAGTVDGTHIVNVTEYLTA